MRLPTLTTRCAAALLSISMASCGYFGDNGTVYGLDGNAAADAPGPSTSADAATAAAPLNTTSAPQAAASAPPTKPSKTTSPSTTTSSGTSSGAPSSAGSASTPPATASVALPGAPLQESTVVTSTPRLVASTMVGLHSYSYPVALVPYIGYQASAPTFPYGIRRSLNYDGTFWRDVHVGSNPANWNWAGLDGVIEDAHARGIKFMYTMMHTPAHLRWPGMEGFPSPAPNWTGSTTMPSNLDEVAAFVTALVKRYNSGGVRKLQYIETWNEPAIDGDNFLASMNVVPYWVGTTADNSAAGKAQRKLDLAILHKAIAVAAKAADPGIQIVAPGWSPGGAAEQASLWVDWFNLAIPGGGTPKQYTDVFAAHPYTSGTNASGILRVLAAYDDARKAVDASKPLMGTEAGNEGPMLSYVDHATVIKRKLMLAAARGFDSVMLYAYEDEQYLGNPWRHPETANAIRDFSQAAVGKTLVRCSILADGTVWAVFSDGTTFRA